MFSNTRLPETALQWKHTFFTCSSFSFSGCPFSYCAGSCLGSRPQLQAPFWGRAAWWSWHCKHRHRVIFWIPMKNLCDISKDLQIRDCICQLWRKVEDSSPSLGDTAVPGVEGFTGFWGQDKCAGNHVCCMCAPPGHCPQKILHWGPWNERDRAETCRITPKVWSSCETLPWFSWTFLLLRLQLVLCPSWSLLKARLCGAECKSGLNWSFFLLNALCLSFLRINILPGATNCQRWEYNSVDIGL